MPTPIMLCKSVHHGNSRAIAEVMAEKLGASLRDPDDLDPDSADLSAVIAVGSGIYYSRFHRSVRYVWTTLADWWPEPTASESARPAACRGICR